MRLKEPWVLQRVWKHHSDRPNSTCSETCIVFMSSRALLPSTRAGLRLQHIAATLTVDSLHTRPYRQAAVRAEAKQASSGMAGTAGNDSHAQAFGPAKLAYTIVYVRDVPKAAEFYQKAFGVAVRRVDHSRRWAELETGATTLAFTPLEQREAAITGGIHAPGADEQRSNVEVCFTFKDVDAAFKHAVSTGAEAVAPPEAKEWGQKVGYVRDPDGVSIRLASELD